MYVLVTGGAGFIGSHTVLQLLEQGYEVIVLDNFSNSSVKALARVAEIVGRDPKIITGDVRDYETLNDLFNKYIVTSVIHFAGLKAVGESVSMPIEYYDNNVFGSTQLFKAMQQHEVKNIVFSSSATVYGDPVSLPLKENMKLGSSTNPYGRTKLMIEDILRDWYKSDKTLSISILRYFNPVGAHYSGKIGEDPGGMPNNLMPYISQTAIGKLEVLSIFGDDYETHDGTGVRDFIHVSDLARGHLFALEKCSKDKGIHTYNLGTGKGTSVLELLNAFEKVNNLKVKYQISNRREGDVAACFADVSKIKNELGWEAQHSISDMCRDAWNWQKQNPDGYDAS